MYTHTPDTHFPILSLAMFATNDLKLHFRFKVQIKDKTFHKINHNYGPKFENNIHQYLIKMHLYEAGFGRV